MLDADEMRQRAAVKSNAESEMSRMDKNRDGVVDQREFLAGGGTREEFSKYDLNGDGVLDADEMEGRNKAKAFNDFLICVNGDSKGAKVNFVHGSLF